jgi:TPR repeat protein
MTKILIVLGVVIAAGAARADAGGAYEQHCREGQWKDCDSAGRIHEEREVDKAVELFLLGCGHGQSCSGIKTITDRLSAAGDLTRAAEILARACSEAKRDELCIESARRLRDGDGVTADPKRAAQMFRAACARDELVACGELARLHRLGKGVPKDKKRAEAIEADVRRKNAELARRSDEKAAAEFVKDHDQYLEWEKQCQAGKAALCALAARPYEKTDPERAFGLAMIGCKSNPLYCPVGMAEEFARRGDAARGAAILQDACDRGALLGCLMLGGWLQRGERVPRDLERATKLYTESCDQDLPFACESLAELYEDGLGVPADPARAAELHRKAKQLTWAGRFSVERRTQAQRDKDVASMETSRREVNQALAAGDRRLLEREQWEKATLADREEVKRLLVDANTQRDSRVAGDRLKGSPMSEDRPRWHATIDRLIHEVLDP